MIGHPYPHCRQASGHTVRHGLRPRQDQRQRSRPKRRHQRLCLGRHVTDQLLQLGFVVNMDDQGIVAGTALSRINFLRCCLIQRIGAQTIDRFGRKGDQFALSET